MPQTPGFWPEHFESHPALNRRVAEAYRRARKLTAGSRDDSGELALARLGKSPLFSPGLEDIAHRHSRDAVPQRALP